MSERNSLPENIDKVYAAADAEWQEQALKRKHGDKFIQQLLELARKQGMNTDDRRNVFRVLMRTELKPPTFILTVFFYNKM